MLMHLSCLPGVMSRMLLVCIFGVYSPGAAHAERTILLVHGSFVAGWYWDPVVQQLEAMGHSVGTVDLTGSAPNPVSDPSALSIEDHINDIVEAIEVIEGEVVLVSHSYGGRPATGAWDRARDQIVAVIYLEAIAPYGSGPLALPDEHVQRARMAEINPQASEAGYLDPPPHLAARYPRRPLAPQSLLALHAAVPLTSGPLPETPGAYVVGSKSNAPIFRQYAQKVSEERGWTIWEIDTGHDMVNDDSDVVTRLISKLATELPDDAR